MLDSYDAKTIPYNGQMLSAYEASQRQRSIERQIRRWKREYVAMKAAGLDTGESAAKIGRWQDAQKDFCKQTGMKIQAARGQIGQYGRSEAQAAKAVDKYSAIRYNRDGTIIPTNRWTSHRAVPKEMKPNTVLEMQAGGAGQIDRTIYDKQGRMVLQVHSGPHSRPDQHKFGVNGEHAHRYSWDDKGITGRVTGELSDSERVQHADILKQGGQ